MTLDRIKSRDVCPPYRLVAPISQRPYEWSKARFGAVNPIQTAGGVTGDIGWTFWAAAAADKTLASIRTDYLEQLTEDTPATDPVEPSPAEFVDTFVRECERRIAPWAGIGDEDV